MEKLIQLTPVWQDPKTPTIEALKQPTAYILSRVRNALVGVAFAIGNISGGLALKRDGKVLISPYCTASRNLIPYCFTTIIVCYIVSLI